MELSLLTYKFGNSGSILEKCFLELIYSWEIFCREVIIDTPEEKEIEASECIRFLHLGANGNFFYTLLKKSCSLKKNDFLRPWTTLYVVCITNECSSEHKNGVK